MLLQPREALQFQIVSRGDARRKVWRVLIWWNQTPREEATWEDYDEIKLRFPEFHLEDKVLLQERGNVKDLSKLRHNLAAKRSRERKKQQRLQSQASTSGLLKVMQMGTQDDMEAEMAEKSDLADTEVAQEADMANVLMWPKADVAEMLTWQKC